MFDDRAATVATHQSVVERALRALLDRTSTVYELSDAVEWHGRRVPSPTVDESTPDALPTSTPGATTRDLTTPGAIAGSSVPAGPRPSDRPPADRSPSPDTAPPQVVAGGPATSEEQEGRTERTAGRRGIEVPDGLARLLEAGAAHLAAARTAAVHQARLAAVQARELAAFAAHRPANLLDRPDQQVGAAAAASQAARPAALTEVSEWAVDEVMAQLGLSSRAAGRLLAESVILVERLPATLAALEEGAISWAHAQVMIDRVAWLDDQTRPAVEAALLAKAAGRTAQQLREAARRAVLKADAAAATRRMVEAVRERSVRVYDEDDGMASLTATMPAPVARACYRALEAYAEACREPGDDRTKDQRMTDCLADLILGTGTSDHPRVQVTLTVVTPAGTLTGGDEPGEIDGHVVPAAMVREVAYALGLLPRPRRGEGAPEGPQLATPAAETGPGTTCTADENTADTAAPETAGTGTGEADAAARSAAGEQTTDLAALLGARSIDGTSLAHRPTVALVDEVSGALLALTDGWTIRRVGACHRRACAAGGRPCDHPPRGAGLGPPGATDAYAPPAALDGFVRARDRRCRFPGCRTRAERCDLDHAVPWPGGPTSAGNLAGLCRHHHRLGHQAPGWTVRRLPDGGLAWTLPGGTQVATHPLPYGTDDPPPPGGPTGVTDGEPPTSADRPSAVRPGGPTRPPPPGSRPQPGPGAEDDPPPF